MPTVELFEDTESSTETLESWVLNKREAWRSYYDSNYKLKLEEYYRLWRGEWAEEDKTRDSERSRLIAPATMQAVEENAAEVEEATFGRGDYFGIKDDIEDQNPEDIKKLRRKLKEDMDFTDTKGAISECILNAAWSGTGIGEIMLDEMLEQKPAVRDTLDGELKAIGVETRERTVIRLRPVLPQNCLNDPNATSVHNGLGVILDEFVGREQVEMLQEKGVYLPGSVGEATTNSDLEVTQDLVVYTDDRVRLTKYFGLVPRHLLEKDNKSDTDEFEVQEIVDHDPESYYVEAIVVLGNDKRLKAEPNPYMMQDRPIVAFQWDIVPGRFLGRGVCEKGYNPQKALDAELRARVDALALTIHPMLAVDSTRMPRGAKPSIRPGKMIKTNGNPSEILKSFNFGNVDQITFAQAAELQKMVQQATGAVNASGMPTAAAGGDAAAGAISMSLGAVLKRHKRTLQSFQGKFLIPLVNAFAWRYMQFDPESYPVGDYKFNAQGSLGMIQREYEVGQLVQLLQTIPADTPAHAVILNSIIENMNLSSREDIIRLLDEANKPDPKAQERQEQAFAIEMRKEEGAIGVMESQSNESNARANKYKVEAEELPKQTELRFQESQFEQVRAASENMIEGDQDEKNFKRRLAILQELRADRKMKVEEENAKTQRISATGAVADAKTNKETLDVALSDDD